jgi:cytochrome c553
VRNFALAIAILISGQVFAQGDAAKGASLYKACIQCHGEKGEGNASEEAPKIAGQLDWYIVSSIEAFKKGVDRKNPKMLPFIKSLSKQDIADLAAYISTM